MNIFSGVAVLITVVALFSYLNQRWLKLPTPIGVMILALGLSLVLIAVGPQLTGGWVRRFALGLDFSSLVLDGMLGFLLFASALQLDARALAKRRWGIFLLAFLSTALSTLFVGGLIYGAFQLLGLTLPLVYAFVFGALISPTDPVAVEGLLGEAGLPEALQTVISGESLFNDGVGIVFFTVILSLAGSQADITAGTVLLDLLREAGGGVLLGVVLGFVTTKLTKRADDYTVMVMLTLAVATGGYTLALALGVSGPITMVTAGLVIGNSLHRQPDRKYLGAYWNVTNDFLNAALFVLIGLEVLIVPFSGNALLAALIAIPAVLLSRYVSVLLALIPVRIFIKIPQSALTLLTWAALRGGIAIALALSIPGGPERDLILVMTYGVVIFSVLVQGLSIKRVAARVLGNSQDSSSQDSNPQHTPQNAPAD